MYTIIGGDQKEYGPISADDVRQWIAEDRLSEQSLMKAESDAEFRTLDKFPEFAINFAAKPPMSDTPPPLAGAAKPGVFSEHDYELDMGGCITRGWELVKNNMGVLFVGALLYLVIEIGFNALANIPVVGFVFSIVNFIISGPLLGGVLYLFIRAIRNEPAEVGDVFLGFRRAFGQLFLGTLVPGLLVGLCMLPFVIVFVVKIIPLAGHFEHMQAGTPPDAETIAALRSILLTSLPLLVLGAIPAIYLNICWTFTLPLIMDKELDFWTAMKTSRKQVTKHWWHVFGLMVLIGLLNFLGVLLCCVGLLFALPIGLAALMFAYETIFSERHAA